MIEDIARGLKMVGKIDQKVFTQESNKDFETCEDRMISQKFAI